MINLHDVFMNPGDLGQILGIADPRQLGLLFI